VVSSRRAGAGVDAPQILARAGCAGRRNSLTRSAAPEGCTHVAQLAERILADCIGDGRVRVVADEVLASTVAPGTTAPPLSVTMPVRVAKVVCLGAENVAWSHSGEGGAGGSRGHNGHEKPAKRTQRKIFIRPPELAVTLAKGSRKSNGVRRLLELPRHG